MTFSRPHFIGPRPLGPRLSKSLFWSSSLEEGAERLKNASQIKNGASRRPARRYTFPNSPFLFLPDPVLAPWVDT